MISLLLVMDLSCTDASDIIGRIRYHSDLENNIKGDLVLTVKEMTPHCPWDAND